MSREGGFLLAARGRIRLDSPPCPCSRGLGCVCVSSAFFSMFTSPSRCPAVSSSCPCSASLGHTRGTTGTISCRVGCKASSTPDRRAASGHVKPCYLDNAVLRGPTFEMPTFSLSHLRISGTIRGLRSALKRISSAAFSTSLRAPAGMYFCA